MTPKHNLGAIYSLNYRKSLNRLFNKPRDLIVNYLF